MRNTGISPARRLVISTSFLAIHAHILYCVCYYCQDLINDYRVICFVAHGIYFAITKFYNDKHTSSVNDVRSIKGANLARQVLHQWSAYLYIVNSSI